MLASLPPHSLVQYFLISDKKYNKLYERMRRERSKHRAAMRRKLRCRMNEASSEAAMRASAAKNDFFMYNTMENVIRIINNYDCQFNKTDILNNNATTLLDFTDYLNLRLTCRNLYTSIKQFLCFNVNDKDYILYKQIIERGDLFLFYNNTPELTSQFIDLFGYIYSQIEASNINIYDNYVDIKRGPEELTQYYTNPELLNRFVNLGITPLHSCACYGNLNVFKILLEYENINIVDIANETPLHIAIKYEYTDIARFIIKNTKIDLDIDNDFGETAFVLACEYGNIEILQLLLASGVDPKKQPHHTVNQLIRSFIERPDVVKILIDYTDNAQDLGFTVEDYLLWHLHHKSKAIKNIKKSIDILQHHSFAVPPRS